MKFVLIITLALSSLVSFGSSEKNMYPWISLSVSPTVVNLWIDNNNLDQSFNCAGYVYSHFNNGLIKTDYYSGFVPARAQAYRSYINYNYGIRIISASHTINCF